MEHLETLHALRQWRTQQRQRHQTVAFVPTMGNLHEGHLQLVDAARKLADQVIVSIYVNPMQFGPNEDLERYPRTLSADQSALTLRGADALFTPDTPTMYPQGTAAQTAVTVPEELTSILCGASRPGHFTGVSTVVCKLFQMVEPDWAVFGKKDYQQLKVIERMVTDLAMPVRLHGVPTAREASGLALSSRNNYLSEAELATATQLNQALTQLTQLASDGATSLTELCEDTAVQLRQAGLTPDYVVIRRQQDLAEPQPGDRQLVALVAAYLGTTRLIDNLEFERSAQE